jgi:hypothetical protein
MPVMTSLVCLMYGRRAGLGRTVVHHVIVRVLMLHKIVLFQKYSAMKAASAGIGANSLLLAATLSF